MQLINECQTAHPNDWKEILLKYIEDFEESMAQNKIVETSQEKIVETEHDKIVETAQDKIVEIYLAYAANWSEEAEYLLDNVSKLDTAISSTAIPSEIPQTTLEDSLGFELKSIEKLFKYQQLYFEKKKELGFGRFLFSWDNIPGYLFCWEEIPGQDDRLIGYLKRNYDINWVDMAKIEKIDGRTIKVFTEKNYILLTLNDEKTKVNLKIDVGQTDEFKAILENGKLNIYITENDDARFIEFLLQNIESDWVETAKIEKTDDRTIIVSTERNSCSLTLNDDKTKAKLEIVGRFAEFNANTVNGKLNIYSNGGKMEKLMKFHNRKQATKISPSFRWDKIPGKDDRKLRNFLMKNYKEIEWVKTAKIEKIDDNKTIMVAKDAKFVSIKLNDEKNRLNCKIDDGRNNEFLVRVKNDELHPIKIDNTPTKLKRSRNILRIPKKMSLEQQIKEIKKFLNSIGITGDMDKIDFESYMDSGVEYNDNFDTIIEVVRDLGLVEKGSRPNYWKEKDFEESERRIDEEYNERELESLEEELRKNFNNEEGFFFEEEGDDFKVLLHTNLLTTDMTCPNFSEHIEEKVVQPFIPSIDSSKMKNLIKILNQNKIPKSSDFNPNRSGTI